MKVASYGKQLAKVCKISKFCCQHQNIVAERSGLTCTDELFEGKKVVLLYPVPL